MNRALFSRRLPPPKGQTCCPRTHFAPLLTSHEHEDDDEDGDKDGNDEGKDEDEMEQT